VNKHQTVIEDGVFVGSDATLVAPVKIGRGAYIAAASCIQKMFRRMRWRLGVRDKA